MQFIHRRPRRAYLELQTISVDHGRQLGTMKNLHKCQHLQLDDAASWSAWVNTRGCGRLRLLCPSWSTATIATHVIPTDHSRTSSNYYLLHGLAVNMARYCTSVQSIFPSKYCTRVQCLTILTANPCNERFIIHSFDQWRLTMINQIQLQRTSEQSERPLLAVHIVSVSRSHR